MLSMRTNRSFVDTNLRRLAFAHGMHTWLRCNVLTRPTSCMDGKRPHRRLREELWNLPGFSNNMQPRKRNRTGLRSIGARGGATQTHTTRGENNDNAGRQRKPLTMDTSGKNKSHCVTIPVLCSPQAAASQPRPVNDIPSSPPNLTRGYILPSNPLALPLDQITRHTRSSDAVLERTTKDMRGANQSRWSQSYNPYRRSHRRRWAAAGPLVAQTLTL
ncbi:hypothetical protein IWZ00DRAFT_295027 [Phyllosticta capitalensis]